MNDEVYRLPGLGERIDQGDIIESCPLLFVISYDLDELDSPTVDTALTRVIVVTQTCDLENEKTVNATCASLLNVEEVIQSGLLKAADVRGPVRAGRVWGWYFLPRNDALGLPELIVDLRQLHTVRLDLLRDPAALGRRRARVQPLYREHLNRHYAETYGRIGLPQPYPTD